MRHTGGKTILIVEDERVVAKELQRSLSTLGYSVPETAASADDAIRLASLIRPDLVLMDIQIKGDKDGIQAVEILRARFDVPVIFLTAYADEATLARAKITEPHGYLVKPVKDADLLSAIEVVLYKHELERRLADRERWFSTTLRAIGDAVIATDTAGEVTFMNLAAERLTGRREDHAVGRSLAEIVSVVDEQTREPLGNPIELALKGGKVVPLPGRAALASGTGERPIDGLASPIVDDKGRLLGAVLVFRDVGEQRRFHQQVAMTDRLSSLGTLTSGIAHEINNPLTAVVGNASYLADMIARVCQDVKTPGARPEEIIARVVDHIEELPEVLTGLQDGAERVRRIVADLQAFSRPQEEVRGRIDLRRVLEWATRMTAAQLRPRARLTMDLGAHPPVEASEVRLGQVFVNLLVNAAHAISEGHPERNEVHVSTSTDGAGRAVVSIRDTGSGMSPEVIKRVFEPFFTTKSVGQGSGLGLSICHGIVKSFGGEITVESKVGVGSTFRVFLPATRTAEASSPAPAVAASRGPRGRILAIDDEPDLVQLLRRTLERDHEVVILMEAREALTVLRESRGFDLVLCDLMMPDLTGMDLYELVRELDPALADRFVFLTGGAFTPRAMKFLDSVSNARLVKPFSTKVLRAFIHDFLRAQGQKLRGIAG
jgi:PAS domain S-box-containing protein